MHLLLPTILQKCVLGALATTFLIIVSALLIALKILPLIAFLHWRARLQVYHVIIIFTGCYSGNLSRQTASQNNTQFYLFIHSCKEQNNIMNSSNWQSSVLQTFDSTECVIWPHLTRKYCWKTVAVQSGSSTTTSASNHGLLYIIR